MSRGALRAQLSLTFEDEQMYDAFIIPYKENKELSSLVVKLLTKYFYNDEVRALVDGSSDSDMQMESEGDMRIDEMFQNAQQLMAYMSVLEDVAQDDLQNGIDAMSDFMNATAEATGGTKETDSQFGLIPARINHETLKQVSQKQVSEEPKKVGESTDEDSDVQATMHRILRTMTTMQANIKRLMRFNGLSDETGDTNEDFSSEEFVSEVESNYENEPVVLDDDIPDSIPTVEDNKVVDEVVIESPKIDVQQVEETTSQVVEETSQVVINTDDKKPEESLDGRDILNEFISNGGFDF